MDVFLERWILKRELAGEQPISYGGEKDFVDFSRVRGLRKPVRVEVSRDLNRGPKWEFGKAQIGFEPASNFAVTGFDSLSSRIQAEFADPLIFGILDVLVGQSEPPVLGVKVVIQTIDADQINSTPATFKRVGQQAGQELLAKGQFVISDESEHPSQIVSGDLERAIFEIDQNKELALASALQLGGAPVPTLPRSKISFGAATANAAEVLLESKDIQAARVRLTAAEAAEPSAFAVESERQFAQHISNSKDLIEMGKVISAKAVLSEVMEDVSKYPDDLRFRAFNNFGVCELSLGNLENAKKFLQRAVEITPDSSIGWSNLAQVALFERHSKEANELSARAVKLQPTPPALAVRLLCLHESEQKDALKSFVKQYSSLLFNNALGLLALGQNAIDERDFPTAEHYLSQCTDLETQNAQAHYLLAASRFLPLQEELKGKEQGAGFLTSEELVRVESAEKAVSRSVDLLKEAELPKRLVSALSLRSVLRAALGRVRESAADLKEVLKLEPDNVQAAILLGRNLAFLDDYSSAEQYLQSIGERGGIQAQVILAETYLKEQKLDEAYSLLKQIVASDERGPIYFQAMDHLIEMEWRRRNTQSLEKLRGELANESRTSPWATYALAQQARREGKFEEACGLLALGAKESDFRLRFSFTRELARWYFDKGVELYHSQPDESKALFSRSADVFATIIDREADTQELREFITAKANSGDEKESARLAKKLRLRQGKAIPVLSIIEAKYESEQGNLQEAAKILESLAVLEPHQYWYRLTLAHAFIKLNQLDRARRVIRTLRNVSDPQQRAMLDWLRTAL